MLLYCGNGRSACATVPPKPGKTALLEVGSVTPALAATARAAAANATSSGLPGAVILPKGAFRISLPSRSELSGAALIRWKFDFSRVPLCPM
jgi:hypothetical protein